MLKLEVFNPITNLYYQTVNEIYYFNYIFDSIQKGSHYFFDKTLNQKQQITMN